MRYKSTEHVPWVCPYIIDELNDNYIERYGQLVNQYADMQLNKTNIAKDCVYFQKIFKG